MIAPAKKQDFALQTLADHHAIVTGGASGIGFAIATELARHGAKLTLTGRREGPLAEAAKSLSAAFEIADNTDATSLCRAVERAVRRQGTPTILINNAGMGASQPFHRMEEAHWEQMLSVNVTGTFRACRAVVPLMREARYGRIVNIASTAGLKGYAYVAAYCAAKHGVIGLTRALAAELAECNVTVNAVCPGYVDTEMTRTTLSNIAAKTGRTEQAALTEIVKHNPQRRLIQPQEVADVVRWLCLPAMGSITGQSIAIAGGEVMP